MARHTVWHGVASRGVVWLGLLWSGAVLGAGESESRRERESTHDRERESTGEKRVQMKKKRYEAHDFFFKKKRKLNQ